MKTIAERLKKARDDAALTQPALAKKAGVSAGTIGNIESGARKEPRELLAIARAVGVNPEWLKTGKGPIKPEGAEMNGWPLSPELLAAMQGATPEQLEILENQARALFRLKARPGAQETDGGAA